MKRMAYVVLIPFLVVSLYCKKEPRVERVGIINVISGTVHIVDGANKTSAKAGDIVKKGMKIETGRKSFVDIYFDENAVKILENSRVDISELELNTQDESETSKFYVNKGKIFSRIIKKLSRNDSFTITTPTASASVRGTEFLVVEEDGKGLVACLTGKVEVKNEASPEKGSVELAKEKEVAVEKGREMSVQDLSADNRKLLKDIKKNFQEMKQDIRERFEKKREEIRKAVQDQRQKNKEMVDKQKAKDLENVEKQKAGDKENVDRLKVISDKTGTEAKEKIDRQREESQKKLEGVKPDIKKFKGSKE
jgi:hypothetical protein